MTVRYFEKLPVRDEDRNTIVQHIDLVGPGAFGLAPGDPSPNRTVYIRCESDDLLALEHKPHYPTSDFHITLYDGDSTQFAKALLRILRAVPWMLRVPLPTTSKLTLLPIKPRRNGESRSPRVYSQTLKQLFHEITGKDLDWNYVISLRDLDRLKITRKILKHFRKATADFPRITNPMLLDSLNSARVGLPNNEPDREVHLTPPELAKEIAQYAIGLTQNPGEPIHFGDPAVGTGAFYSALLRVVPRQRVASAIGIDISDRQIAAAKLRWQRHGMEVIHGDYLHMERLPHRNLILANPPYLRHQEIPQQYKRELRERASVVTSMQVSARSGLYIYFLLLSHSWMDEGAVAAWLIPSEFMQTDYGESLRYYLTHHVELIRIHRFSHEDPQFESAKVLPAVVFFRKRVPSRQSDVLLTAGGTLLHPRSQQCEKIEELRTPGRWFVPAVASDDQARVSNIRIGDLFEVRRGIATGANDFFILERDDAVQLGIPTSALRPVLPKARLLRTDIVEAAPDGYPIIEPQLCLLDCDLEESEIVKKYPGFARYLQTASRLGILDRNLVRHRRPWYKQERRAPAPFLCTYMGRGSNGGPPIRFIWNKSDAIATNTYLMLYPRPKVAKYLLENRDAGLDLFAALHATAKSSIQASLRMHADGLLKIEPGDLSGVRVASAPKWATDVVERDLVFEPE